MRFIFFAVVLVFSANASSAQDWAFTMNDVPCGDAQSFTRTTSEPQIVGYVTGLLERGYMLRPEFRSSADKRYINPGEAVHDQVTKLCRVRPRITEREVAFSMLVSPRRR